MPSFTKTLTIILSMATLWVAMSFKIAEEGKLAIVLDHYIGNKPLQLDTVNYKNDLGQSFTVTKFRYYISNIRLKKSSGEYVNFKGYYLVDQDEEGSNKIALDHVPVGQYTGIDFMVGVDSAHNCSGAQSGALDPANGMFWAWNTGYIFLKLEGKAPLSTSPGHIFEYHIGGYKRPTNCIRSISLSFNELLTVAGTKDLHIKVDAAEILKTPTTIDFSKLSSVTDFHNAPTIADNYADMFSIPGQ